MNNYAIGQREARRAGRRAGSFARTKAFFFDREAVNRMLDAQSHEVLSHFGALVMTIARNSIKSRLTISSPGQPPSSHVGYQNRLIRKEAKAKGQKPPKLSNGIREIYYSYDPEAGSVVIGPIRFNSSELAATSQAAGANLNTLALLEYGGHALRRVAEFVVDGQKIWVSSRNAPMRTCTYKARPFMGPAFTKAEEKLPEIWAKSVY